MLEDYGAVPQAQSFCGLAVFHVLDVQHLPRITFAEPIQLNAPIMATTLKMFGGSMLFMVSIRKNMAGTS